MKGSKYLAGTRSDRTTEVKKGNRQCLLRRLYKIVSSWNRVGANEHGANVGSCLGLYI